MQHRSSSQRLGIALAVLTPLSFLAACGGDDDKPETSPSEGASGGSLGTVRVALTSPTQPNWVATKFGVLTHGEELGLEMTIDDFTTFDSHSVATQTVLSGQADIVAGSFVSNLLLINQGQDFKAFCPYISQDDFVVAGANGVSTIDQLFDSGTRVAMDSPGGAGSVIFDAILQASGETRTTADMPGQQILESSGLRTSAYAAGEVDATIIHEPQFEESAAQVTDPVIIATLYKEVPNYLKEVQAAPAKWLKENKELAATYCAGVLMGMRELSGDFDLFATAAEEYSEAGVTERPALEASFKLINEYGFWPYEDGGLGEEVVGFMSDVAIKSGLLEKAPAYEDVVDQEVLKRALEIAAENS